MRIFFLLTPVVMLLCLGCTLQRKNSYVKMRHFGDTSEKYRCGLTPEMLDFAGMKSVKDVRVGFYFRAVINDAYIIDLWSDDGSHFYGKTGCFITASRGQKE